MAIEHSDVGWAARSGGGCSDRIVCQDRSNLLDIRCGDPLWKVVQLVRAALREVGRHALFADEAELYLIKKRIAIWLLHSKELAVVV